MWTFEELEDYFNEHPEEEEEFIEELERLAYLNGDVEYEENYYADCR